MINEARLIGNVGNRPEVTHGGGWDRANFSLATTEKWKNKNGDWQERTQWHRLVTFNKFHIEKIEKYVDKGTLLYIEGSIQYEEYEKNGEKRHATSIRVTKIIVLARKKGESEENGGYYDHGVSDPPPMGDDVPF